jgi:excisionase family DNA binding protein
MEGKSLLTISEAARRLSLGRATAYRLVQLGELPSVHIGRAVRVPARALEDWVRARTSGGGAPPHADGAGPPPAVVPRPFKHR